MKWLASWLGKLLVVADTPREAESHIANLGKGKVRAAPIHESSLPLLKKQEERGAKVVRLDKPRSE